MKTALLPAAALALLAASWCPGAARADDKDKKDAPKGDLAKLQGKWATKVGPNKDIDTSIAVDGKALVLKLTTPDGQDIEIKGEISVDGDAKPHKTITWTKFTNRMGDALPDNLGIYAFEDDDTVKICNGGPGNERPKEFKAEEGGSQLFTLKRDKSKKADAKPKENKD